MRKHLKTKKWRTGQVIPFVQNGEYYFKKGLAAYRRRDLYRAKKYLERAVHLSPNEPMFLCELAVVLSDLGEYQAANQLFLMIVNELDPEMTECFYFIANNYAHLGLFREAMKYAEMYIECEPDGNFVEETEDLLELLSIENEDGHMLDNQDDLIVKQERARNLLEKGQFTEAIQLLETIIQDYPQFWSAYNNLALCYFYIGNVKKAQHMIAEVLRQNPGNLHALCNMLVFYYYLHEEQEVHRLIRKLESVYPFLIEHRYKLGATFALVGRFDLAFKWLYNLYKMGFDGDGAFYYWLSYAAYYRGYKQFAETMWKKVIHLSPEKQGQEPWSSASSAKPQEMVRIQQWLNSENTSEILYGLYLVGKSFYKDELIKQTSFQQHLHSNSFIQSFANYIVSPTSGIVSPNVADSFSIVDELWKNNDVSDERMCIAWFYIFGKAAEFEYDFSNHSAWAAATEYVWGKKNGENTTQQSIAEKYGISISTVKRYVKMVKSLLR
ncbi:tetratricopeptide (TPR) repeat protein [Anoxybacillus calidus]|jgi:Flp pilus assembly protein TadD|uniref:Tetratricopeptide (TPR) repeat protein n=1 Tax=[Anoxybacillus] calidus TaxID=575178 RepID=A0A7W0BV07_9BACL|nr:tetratricopeptide repeat protein [Anoxybacillus calidus]MBA2871373.1 tetratricopeptide (TPR) repeat protein [Anoxybacillus calidus]